MMMPTSRMGSVLQAPGRAQQLLQRWFLGPNASFRNAARTWIYLGFVSLFLAMVGVLSILRPS